MDAPAFDARVTLVDSDSASDEVGVRFRRTPSGPELELIESFLETVPLRIPSGCRATIFREPRLESGFPDLVVVVWREVVARNWRPERGLLETRDLRIMHYLYQTRRGSAEELLARFGRSATGSIERLQDAAMIRAVGSSWIPVGLRSSYAALNITAIEAKVGKWSEALNQALLNTWFASESYVLVPNMPSRQQVADAQRLGIGIRSLENRALQRVTSRSTRVPQSYASWMFNDWAWRFAQHVRPRVE